MVGFCGKQMALHNHIGQVTDGYVSAVCSNNLRISC